MIKKVKINLFGEMWKLTKLNVDEVLQVDLQKRAHQIGLPWPEALLSIEFFDNEKFGLYSNYENLCETRLFGLLNSYKNQIEIWFEGKKIKKLNINDLNSDFLLFPLYQSVKEVFNYISLEEGVYVEQFEIGLVACYEGEIVDFKLDNFVFHTLIIENKEEFFEVLSGICYKKTSLTANDKKIDTLITRQLCFEV